MKLVTATEAPHFTLYPGVLNHYRPLGISHVQALVSLFKFHTETVNAWSMIFNVVFVNAIGWWLWPRLPKSYMVVPLIEVTVASHAIASVGYHLFMPCSEETAVFWRKLDVTFILLFGWIWTYCLNVFVFNYKITIVLTAFAAIEASQKINWLWTSTGNTHANQPPYPKLIQAYGSLITCYLSGMIYMSLSDAVSRALLLSILGCMVASGVMLVFGIPERLFPGKFDLIGTSHQWMHLLIVFIAHNLEIYFIWHAYCVAHKN